MSRKKLVIDCDVGTDDAQAILMALAYPEEVEIVAITAVYGNATLEHTARNTLRLLKFCDRLDIPVYAGCDSSLLGVGSLSNCYHGVDALGDVPELYGAGDAKCRPDPAPSALCTLTRKHQGELTLVALGPLTNVATALQLDPNFGKNLKEAFIMGGNTSGRGNITCCAEFNFYSDPEAAQCVLNHLHAPITLLPLELCEQYSFSWEWYETFSKTPTDKAAFIKTVEKHMVTGAKEKNQPKYWCWDQLAAAVAINSKLITAAQEVYATVELQGTYTRGQVVVDWRSKWGKDPNVTLVTTVDKDTYEKMLFAAIGKE